MLNQWRSGGVPADLLVQAAGDVSTPAVEKPPDESSLILHQVDRITDRKGIFFSLRFNNSVLMAQAEKIQALLRARDIEATIVKVSSGGDIEARIVAGLSTCRLALIFGTEDYGEEGTVHYSTRGELLYILDQKIPFFLLKMCSQFKDQTTCFRLPSAVSYYPLKVGAKADESLISEIVTKYNSVPNVSH
jgi:hypothetical protein